MTLRRAMFAAIATVVAMNVNHRGYENHWWWDNVGHLLSGFAVGAILPEGREREGFLVIAIVWEGFEYCLARAKLYERFDWCPEGPRSLGFEPWSFDHQVEDTILDVVVGYWGAKLAQRLKQREVKS